MRHAFQIALIGTVLLSSSCDRPDGDDPETAATADTLAADAVEAADPDAAYPENGGIVARVSSNPFDVTLEKARNAIADQGFAVITSIDHSAAAERAGMSIPRSTVLIFGKPEAGTALIDQAPTVAIDLPLKLLIWETSNEYDETIVRVAANDAGYLAWRHELDESSESIQAMRAAVGEIVSRSVSPR